MKYFAAAALTAILTAGAASAATTSAQTVNWSSAANPVTGSQSGSYTASSDEVFLGSNGSRAFVSDVTTSGDFTYTGTMRATNDNDTMGVVFGYADAANNFRISWSGSNIDEYGGGGMMRVN